MLLAGQIAFVSGAAAAVGSGVVKVPVAVCIRSVQAGVYPDVFAAARSIVKAAGPRGLFTVSLTPSHTAGCDTRGVCRDSSLRIAKPLLASCRICLEVLHS